MGPFAIFVVVVAIATSAHDGTAAEPDPPVPTPVLEQPSESCPTSMAEPRVRNLTVPFDDRVYLLPSGETCRPASMHTTGKRTGETDGSPQRSQSRETIR
ncbi:MAG: hypothetical protein U5R46_08565 [Gammaproteobacteria bacterium]|nr:hypothetical protein [Gammaproteobacteria bacterium]